MAEVINLFGGEHAENPNAVHGDGMVTKDYAMDEVINGFVEIKDRFDNVTIVGSSADGRFYFSSSSGDIRQVLYDLESAKQMTMDHGMQFRPAEEDE